MAGENSSSARGKKSAVHAIAPSQIFKTVAPNLKRNANGTYFAFAKRNGKFHKQSLETTDRATANRKLKEFIENLDVTDRKFESMSLNQLLDRYLETIKGKAPSTIATWPQRV